MKELYEALITLGVKETIVINRITTDRVAVYVAGEYYGIWDIKRKTFVD